MRGCYKWKVDINWMKIMINWDLFSHLKVLEFNAKVSNNENKLLFE